MRNSILRDYLEEKDLVKYKRTNSPQISENEIEMMTKLGSVFEKIRSDHDIKGVNGYFWDKNSPSLYKMHFRAKSLEIWQGISSQIRIVHRSA